jgi:hypothetical protein
MLARNLPEIRPSEGFSARLQERLAMERGRPPMAVTRQFRGPGVRAFIAVAASIVVVGFVASRWIERSVPSAELVVESPALSIHPARVTAPSPPIATPALVSSISAGVSVWPVLYLAEQAPIHFARAQFDPAAGTQ